MSYLGVFKRGTKNHIIVRINVIVLATYRFLRLFCRCASEIQLFGVHPLLERANIVEAFELAGNFLEPAHVPLELIALMLDPLSLFFYLPSVLLPVLRFFNDLRGNLSTNGMVIFLTNWGNEPLCPTRRWLRRQISRTIV
jgi:hypothetical protein